MVAALLSTRSQLLGGHAVIGCSTGYMTAERGNWPELVERAAAISSLAVELSALSEPELPGLLDYLRRDPQLPFRYVSMHGPSKERSLDESKLVESLMSVPLWVDAIVMHPDTIQDADRYLPLGSRLVLENMASRKDSGRSAEELESLFSALPDAGLCFDIAHAKAVDETMALGEEMVYRYADRLRHIHVSSLDGAGHHRSLTPEDQELFSPVLESCRDVPWILEAPPPGL